jgi:hypothetical protein
MALHITDPNAEAAVRKLARLRGLTLTRAVEVAATEALERSLGMDATDECIAELQREIAAVPDRPGPRQSHKEFMDRMWARD